MSTPPAPRRRLPRILLVVAAALVALVLLAWGALAILFPPARVRALVQAQLGKSLSREVRFADAGLVLFPPVRLTIQRAALSEPDGFSAGTAFQARSIHLDLDVPALIGRRLVVRRLILDEPALHLLLRPDGTTNLDGLVKPEPAGGGGGKAMDFTLKELGVRRGRLLVDDLKVSARRTVVVDTKLALATRSGARRYTTSGATVLSDYAFGPLSAARLADLNTSLAKLRVTIEHSGAYDADLKRLALERLDIGLGRARIGMAGVVDDPGPKARFDLRARGSDIDLAEVLHAVAAADARALHGLSGSGQLAFDLAIRGGTGPGATKSATGTVAVSRAAFRYPGAPVGVEGLAFTARLAPDSLAIGDLVARVSGQPLRGRLQISRFDDPRVRFAVQGNMDLAAVAPLVAPKDTKLAGKVALDVTGQGRAKDPGSMALAGVARLTDVSVESPVVPKRIEGVNGTVGFSESRAQVGGLTARAGQSAITLDATVTRPLALLAKPGAEAPSQVQFDLRSPRLDLAEVLPPASGPPIVLNATGGGHVAIDRFINQKLDVQRLRSDVTLEPGIIHATKFSMAAYGGAIGGAATLDLRDPAKPSVVIKAQVDSLSADALVSTWTPVRNFVQGALSSSVDLQVSGATPAQMLQSLTVEGLAQIARGQLGPGPVLGEVAKLVKIPAFERLRFEDAKLPFHVRQGRIVSDPSVLRGGHGEWRLAGSVGFDGTLDYAVSATLPPSVTQALNARSALAAGALTDANGNLLLDLRVTGPARAPRVAWDPSAMKDRVAGKVSQALAEQQQRLEDELKQAAQAQQRAAEDSLKRATERLKQSVADSLRRRAGDVLRGFFGAPKDTTARP